MSFWKVYAILLGGLIVLTAFSIGLHYLEGLAGGKVLASIFFIAGMLALVAWAAKFISNGSNKDG